MADIYKEPRPEPFVKARVGWEAVSEAKEGLMSRYGYARLTVYMFSDLGLAGAWS